MKWTFRALIRLRSSIASVLRIVPSTSPSHRTATKRRRVAFRETKSIDEFQAICVARRIKIFAKRFAKDRRISVIVTLRPC
jgi:hypothetical protein